MPATCLSLGELGRIDKITTEQSALGSSETAFVTGNHQNKQGQFPAYSSPYVTYALPQEQQTGEVIIKVGPTLIGLVTGTLTPALVGNGIPILRA